MNMPSLPKEEWNDMCWTSAVGMQSLCGTLIQRKELKRKEDSGTQQVRFADSQSLCLHALNIQFFSFLFDSRKGQQVGNMFIENESYTNILNNLTLIFAQPCKLSLICVQQTDQTVYRQESGSHKLPQKAQLRRMLLETEYNISHVLTEKC